MENNCYIKPPVSLTKPMVLPEKLLMGPGPTNCSPRVLHAMSRLVTGHLHKETIQIMDEIKEGLQYLFQTNNTLTLAVSSTGHGGMEATLCNLLEAGETVLIAKNGIWGERAANMAKRYGAIVHFIETDPGKAFTMDEFEKALILHKPVVLFVTHGESSTGVLQPLEGLGDLCHKYNCLLAVDSVAALGGVPVFTDKWNIDVIYTGSQKVISAPPGLAPITFSKLAEKKLFDRKTPVTVYYWDMKELGKYWGCFGNQPRIYHHTIPVSLAYALREALAEICEEGLESLWKRHEICANYLYSGLERLGFELFVINPKHRSPTVTSVQISNPLCQQLISYAMKTNCLEISGGLGPTVNKIMRIGIMGFNARKENVERVLNTLELAKDDALRGKL